MKHKITVTLELDTHPNTEHVVYCQKHGETSRFWRIYIGNNPNPLSFCPQPECLPLWLRTLLSQFPVQAIDTSATPD